MFRCFSMLNFQPCLGPQFLSGVTIFFNVESLPFIKAFVLILFFLEKWLLRRFLNIFPCYSKLILNKHYNIFLYKIHTLQIQMKAQFRLSGSKKSFFNSYRSNSKGVDILLNNKCEIRIHNQFHDNNGNHIFRDVTVETLNFILYITLYLYYSQSEYISFQY